MLDKTKQLTWLNTVWTACVALCVMVFLVTAFGLVGLQTGVVGMTVTASATGVVTLMIGVVDGIPSLHR